VKAAWSQPAAPGTRKDGREPAEENESGRQERFIVQWGPVDHEQYETKMAGMDTKSTRGAEVCFGGGAALAMHMRVYVGLRARAQRGPPAAPYTNKSAQGARLAIAGLRRSNAGRRDTRGDSSAAELSGLLASAPNRCSRAHHRAGSEHEPMKNRIVQNTCTSAGALKKKDEEHELTEDRAQARYANHFTIGR